MSTEAAVPASQGVPFSVYLDPEGGVERDLMPSRLVDALEAHGQLWVDIEASSRHQHALLEKVFHFHPLAIEDTLTPKTRVKLEEYPDYLFLVVPGVRFDEATSDPYDIEATNLYCFLGHNYLVTVHSGPSRTVAEVQERLERSPELLSRGVEMLLHGVVDAAVDHYLPMVDQVDVIVDDLEERVFGKHETGSIEDVFKVRRLIVQLRRHLAPLREVLNALTNRPHPCIAPSTQVYFRDVYDHTIRIVESVEAFRDLLATVLDIHLTQASNQMNQVMKSLSVVATISLPLVVLAGVFGMNFQSLPLIHNPWGFIWAIALMAALAGAMFWVLRRRGWV
jgi:magnesium transporter